MLRREPGVGAMGTQRINQLAGSFFTTFSDATFQPVEIPRCSIS